ncbi:hypothetical protein [Streptomyces sp. NPDC093089]|uniref:hypothetical protein n=1 Tax=Streptomyces sp. NPDC093089 TaxID=3366024 RepID=UPI0037FC8549
MVGSWVSGLPTHRASAATGPALGPASKRRVEAGRIRGLQRFAHGIYDAGFMLDAAEIARLTEKITPESRDTEAVEATVAMVELEGPKGVADQARLIGERADRLSHTLGEAGLGEADEEGLSAPNPKRSREAYSALEEALGEFVDSATTLLNAK